MSGAIALQFRHDQSAVWVERQYVQRVRRPSSRGLPPVKFKGHDEEILAKYFGVGENPLLEIPTFVEARLRERDLLNRRCHLPGDREERVARHISG